MIEWLSNGDSGLVPTDFAALAIAVLLAFVCGQLVAWGYMFTHSGLSYSRSYVNTLLHIPVMVALVMMILANNLVIAFGLMAIFAMVRFRSVLRDTLDTAYVLAVIVIGLACGTMKFTSAIVACLSTLGIMFFTWSTSFGARQRYDVILNLQWMRPAEELTELLRLLQRHSRAVYCASQRSGNDYAGMDLSYRLLLRDPARGHELMEEVRSLRGVVRAASIGAAEESEV